VLLQGCAAWWGGVVPLGPFLTGHLVVSGHTWGGGGGDVCWWLWVVMLSECAGTCSKEFLGRVRGLL
jgi:hypothetical protein